MCYFTIADTTYMNIFFKENLFRICIAVLGAVCRQIPCMHNKAELNTTVYFYFFYIPPTLLHLSACDPSPCRLI